LRLLPVEQGVQVKGAHNMDKLKKLDREKNAGILKILISIVFSVLSGYIVYALIGSGFFLDWEIYFAIACYVLIVINLLIIDIGIIRWIHYTVYIEDGKLKIRDGFFSRIIPIPIERVYYLSSVKLVKGIDYDTLLIVDKKIGHKKIKRLSLDELYDKKEHMEAITWLEEMYPEKTFYYYRVYHHGYKFSYFFYLVYRNCEKCRLSDVSISLVKDYAESK
jgi:hypothetical protein